MSKMKNYERKQQEKIVIESVYWSLGGQNCSAISNIVTNQKIARKLR